MAGHLETAQGDDPEKIADMKAVGSGVEPAVGGRRPLVQQGPERLVTDLVDEAAKGEVVRELQHPQSVPRCRRRGERRTVVPRTRAKPPQPVRKQRVRLRPRARRAGPRSPCGHCARRRLPARAGRRWRALRRASRATSSRDVTSVAAHPGDPGEVGDVDPLRSTEQPLEEGLVELRSLRQEREDAAPAVVDDDQHGGERGLAPAPDEGRRVVQEGEVADAAPRPARLCRRPRRRRRGSWRPHRRCRWRPCWRAPGAGPSAGRRTTPGRAPASRTTPRPSSEGGAQAKSARATAGLGRLPWRAETCLDGVLGGQPLPAPIPPTSSRAPPRPSGRAAGSGAPAPSGPP